MKLSTILITLILSMLIDTRPVSAQYVDVSFQVFYDQLSPYGYWIDSPEHGYVWVPNAEPDFVPYSTSGYWIMTDCGMTWISNYRWGWAPFHYGRWGYDNFYGWFWVPGHEWGPAWVTWRSASGYYGWAPMGPGISISISFGNHYSHNYNHWIFVRARDIDRHDIHRYRVHHGNYDRIIRSSTVINNTYIDNSRHVTYVTGPRREQIQRTTGRNIRNVALGENKEPGQEFRNNQLNIYRPRITNNGNQSKRTAPVRLSNIDEVKGSRTKTSGSEIQNQRQTTYQTNNVRNNTEVKLHQPSDNKQNNRQNTDQSNQIRQKRQVNSTSNTNIKNTNRSSDNNRKQPSYNSNNQNNNNRTKVSSGNTNRQSNQKNSRTTNQKQSNSRQGENKGRK